MIDYSLYLVTDRTHFSKEEFLSIIVAACQHGITLIQLREKDITTIEYVNWARDVKQITDNYGVPLIINDRVDVCMAVDASGVHIGPEDLPVKEARKIIGEDKILGVSANDVPAAISAYKDQADYIGVGSIFKKNQPVERQMAALKQLKSIVTDVPIPVVAIGGLTETNLYLLRDSGVAGVAMISEIMQSSNVTEKTKQLRRSIQLMKGGIYH
ncbi:MAG: thiamine phosphate synthase [Bavariicoccus seileri]|uniref:thiamine phosphate synthase n=1 Tax=Bavariicoccus seileri TaxID=549685 RepID=UPI003F913454